LCQATAAKSSNADSRGYRVGPAGQEVEKYCLTLYVDHGKPAKDAVLKKILVLLRETQAYQLILYFIGQKDATLSNLIL